MSFTNRRRTRFAQSEVLHFSFSNQVLKCTGNVFHWDIGIHAMLIQKINVVGLQSRERLIDDFSDVLRLTIKPASHLAILNIEAEFAAKSDVLSERRYRLAD